MDSAEQKPGAPAAAALTWPPGRAVFGVLLVAFAVFITELSLMRAVAQVTWPPFAFIALSAAMLGGGASGTLFAVKPRLARREQTPVVGALVVAVCSPAALLFALTSGLEPLRVGEDAGATLTFALALLFFALPFAGLGCTLAAFLETHGHAAKRIYGADLVGGALGAFLSVPLIDLAGPLGASFVAAAVAAAGAMLLFAGRRMRAFGALTFGVAVALALAQVVIIPSATVDKRIGDQPASEVLKKLAEADRLLTKDRADARIDVVPARPAPRVLIDLGAAVTRAPVFPTTGAPPADHVSASFMVRPPERVLVIGAGAGYEVARAVAHGASHVDAVEILRGIADALPDRRMGGGERVYRDERVHFHHAEARAFLERVGEKYSHILAIHTITNAALAAGAMRLSEDFLFTREAMATYLNHLDEDGILFFTRPRAQMPLLIAMVKDALATRGIASADLDKHLVSFGAQNGDPFFAGLLVFVRPPNKRTLSLPKNAVPVAFPPHRGALPSDDKPFFHRFADEGGAVPENARLAIETPKLAERAVLMVGIFAVIAALLTLVLPLWLKRKRHHRRPPLTPLLISALLGLGFMFAELSLAQRFTLICGRPLVAFSTVVGGMLLGAGGFALLVQHRATPLRKSLLLAAGALLASIVAPAILMSLGAMTWPIAFRVLAAGTVAGLLTAPLGLPFPALVEAISDSSQGAAAWLYAVNAVLAVLASALFAALAPHLGLMGMALVAAGIYALAGVLARGRS